MHPREPCLFVSGRSFKPVRSGKYRTRAITYMIHLPPHMPSVPSSRASNWALHAVEPPATIEPFCQSPSIDGTWILNLWCRRSTSTSSWILGALFQVERGNNSGFEFHTEDDMINEVNLELSDNTTRTHSLNLSPLFNQDCAMPLKGDWVSSTIFEVRAREHHVSESGVVMVVPKLENGNGHGSCWVRLVLPAPLKAKLPGDQGPNVPVIGWPGAYWSASPCVFDLYTAKMYLWLPDGLHVLQYGDVGSSCQDLSLPPSCKSTQFEVECILENYNRSKDEHYDEPRRDPSHIMFRALNALLSNPGGHLDCHRIERCLTEVSGPNLIRCGYLAGMRAFRS